VSPNKSELLKTDEMSAATEEQLVDVSEIALMLRCWIISSKTENLPSGLE
jgi:hypothetical protein